jgi:2-methylisocitrate lyase-like PEP mutase family enzyme
MKKIALLEGYILNPEILVMPGAHNALSARIREKAGFKALPVGGYSATAMSFLTLTKMVVHIAWLTAREEIYTGRLELI